MKGLCPLAAVFLLAALPAFGQDDRSIEILRFECKTDTTRREVTLFGNGTLRVRDGALGNEGMGLIELGPDDLKGYLNRLSAESLKRDRSPVQSIQGTWVEHCELRLQLPNKDLQTYRFGHYDSLPLNLSKVVHIAEELGRKIEIVKEKDEIPADYDPEPGDVLKRAGDGALFRIVRFTSDKKGIELRGVALPLEMYVPKDKVRQSFTAVMSRGGFRER